MYLGQGGGKDETIDLSCTPRTLARVETIDGQSPMVDQKSNLKLEDLATQREKQTTPYNPVWKLQVTDEKSKVLYEKKYVDKNVPGTNQQEYRLEEKAPAQDGYRARAEVLRPRYEQRRTFVERDDNLKTDYHKPQQENHSDDRREKYPPYNDRFNVQ